MFNFISLAFIYYLPIHVMGSGNKNRYYLSPLYLSAGSKYKPEEIYQANIAHQGPDEGVCSAL